MEAAERIEVEVSRTLGALLPARMLEAGGAVAFAMPALPEVRMMNRAVGITARTTDAELDEIEAFFRELGVLYQLAPGEPGLDERFAVRGLVPGYAWMKFVHDMPEMPEARTNLRVDRVDGSSAEAFAHVMRETWDFPDALDGWLAAMIELPGWTCYVTYDGEEPAGAAALYVNDGVAWLGFGSTRPAFRGRGSQGALFSARAADAAAQGARLFVTETGVAGEDGPGASYRNILRAGFREAYARPNYIRR